VHFIYDIDAKTACYWPKTAILPQAANLIYASIGGAVYLLHISEVALRNGRTAFTLIAGSGSWPLFAIDCLGQDAGHGGLAHTPWPAEDQGMRQPVLLNCILQGLCYMALTYHLFKGLGTEFSCKDQIQLQMPPIWIFQGLFYSSIALKQVGSCLKVKDENMKKEIEPWHTRICKNL
jgi:hypothetical protein